MKKKYTIVYAATWHSGSHSFSTTSFDCVETDDLSKLIAEDKYRNLWFVFDGWCEITKD
jgi:hypothetical protein